MGPQASLSNTVVENPDGTVEGTRPVQSEDSADALVLDAVIMSPDRSAPPQAIKIVKARLPIVAPTSLMTFSTGAARARAGDLSAHAPGSGARGSLARLPRASRSGTSNLVGLRLGLFEERDELRGR